MEESQSGTNGLNVDMKKLIRSVQRLEGNPDCFGKSRGDCDRIDCAWREYCLAFDPESTI